MASSVAEHAIPLVSTLTEVFVLGLLIASRDAARVALGGMHLVPPLLELPLTLGLGLSALNRSAPRMFAVRSHRFLQSVGFSPAYHLTTG
jgi:hypothetical protein